MIFSEQGWYRELYLVPYGAGFFCVFQYGLRKTLLNVNWLINIAADEGEINEVWVKRKR